MASDRESRDGWDEAFEEHSVMELEVTSNLADGGTVDVNGTQLKIFQHTRHIPMVAEIYVESESEPIGTINTAKGETVCLGGVEEALAERVDEIRDLPVEEIPEALDELAQRLNPPRSEVPDDGAE